MVLKEPLKKTSGEGPASPLVMYYHSVSLEVHFVVSYASPEADTSTFLWYADPVRSGVVLLLLAMYFP